MSLRKELVEIIDRACWDARRYGHEDYDLEQPLEGETFHPSAVEAADKILRAWRVEA